ncbi:hypothetical protein ACOMHN_006854 [Nucella lapillus]
MLRRHGCYKNGSTGPAFKDSRERRGGGGGGEVHTISTPITSSPVSHFWNGDHSPSRLHLDESGAMLTNDYSQI